MQEHAVFSASGASRRINCLGSLREIKKLHPRDQNPQTIYADEGTAAHGLAATCLKDDTDPDQYRGTFVPGKMIVDGELTMYEVNDEMIDAIQVYVDCVRGHLKRLGPAAVLYIEKRVYPILEDEETFFGTADAIIVEEVLYGEIVVVDFKYGRGVVVEVYENDQAKFYGLGALRRVTGISTAKIVIAQPRAFHPDGPVRDQDIPAHELEQFAGVLIGANEAAKDPNAPLKAGDWCTFCPARGVCPELEKKRKEVAKAEFSGLIASYRAGAMPEPEDLVTLPNPENLEVLAEAWLSLRYLDYIQGAVTGMVLRLVESGEDFEFAKMVRKRSNRKWVEEDEAQLELDMKNAVRRAESKLGVKIGSGVIYEPRKLKSVAALEKYSFIPEGKTRGKRVLKEYVKGACVKKEGGLTLVYSTDPREAIPQETLAETFAEQIEKQKQLEAGGKASEEETKQ